MIRLGAENKEEANPMTVRFDGRVRWSLFGAHTFKGVFEVENDPIPVPDNSRRTVIRFGRPNFPFWPIYYDYLENGIPRLYAYGGLFAGRDLREFVIVKYEDEETADGGERRRTWNPDSGLLIVVPAETREGALERARRLMGRYLQDTRWNDREWRQGHARLMDRLNHRVHQELRSPRVKRRAHHDSGTNDAAPGEGREGHRRRSGEGLTCGPVSGNMRAMAPIPGKPGNRHRRQSRPKERERWKPWSSWK